MSKIADIHAREVLDSRGNPTVEVDVTTKEGHAGRAIVPSGKSTGTAEAVELRDDNATRYDGRGVLRAVENINSIMRPALIGASVIEQHQVDQRLVELDGTAQKSRLGANASLGVSLAVAHAGAASVGLPLYRYINQLYFGTAGDDENQSPQMPLPMTNMISGGLHAGGNLDFQDVLIIPRGAADYRTGLEWIVRTYRRLGELLVQQGFEGRLVGDEGGFGPRLDSNRQAIEFAVMAIEAAGLRPGDDVTLALDVAATHFFDGEFYQLAAENNEQLTASDMIDRLESLVDDFPITSLEDGLAEEDWDGWRKLTARLGDRVQIVGDDLFATNPQRVRRGLDSKAANSVLIKLNQIGTLTETFETMRIARHLGATLVVSARSGETEDTTIADLAVGTRAEMIKIGSIVRSERLAKYNQLLRIAEQID